MSTRGRQAWRARDVLLLLLLVSAAIWAHRQPLLDILTIGWRDEEQTHIFLAPLVAAWLFYLRRSRLRYVPVRPSLIGPALLLGGWLLSYFGFAAGVQIAWHGGALLSVFGAVLTMTGTAPVSLFSPVILVLVFLLPVPGVIRQQIAWPLQELATTVTHGMLGLMGVGAVKTGNMLIINGEQVAVGEACNGMRMVFALTLVVYAFAFGSPFKPATRLVLLALSPVVAIICNVIRLVPTSLIFGYGSIETAHRFHDISGWVMLPIALFVLALVLRTIRWLEFPVMSFRLASQ